MGRERWPFSSCTACRYEVDETGAVGDQLLDLIPDAEPPLGFDRSVLAAIGHRSEGSRRFRLVTAAAALAAAIAGVIGFAVTDLTGPSRHLEPAELTAVLHQGERSVGTVYVGGHPTWVTMNVDHAALTGTVTCQLVARDGTVITVGDFQLVEGSGKWGAPDPQTTSELVGARLIGPDGKVMATATFTTS
ncbi:MAG TPA: hypothetical protein VNF71_10805 [Acidimicrobiales bacterium]|nr:hypothetical protein [Acidimicrobiales bacterium]